MLGSIPRWFECIKSVKGIDYASVKSGHASISVVVDFCSAVDEHAKSTRQKKGVAADLKHFNGESDFTQQNGRLPRVRDSGL